MEKHSEGIDGFLYAKQSFWKFNGIKYVNDSKKLLIQNQGCDNLSLILKCQM